jgi:N-methylhydantoinase B
MRPADREAATHVGGGDDPIRQEVIRYALAAGAEEASIVVMEASHSTFIQEGADACAAVVDATGGLISLSVATSLIHASSVRLAVRSLLDDFELAKMADGDIYALNEPSRGGIHANDFVIMTPVVRDGRPIAFGCTLVHVADVGGIAAGGLAVDAADVFAEGIVLPPLRLGRNRKLDPVLTRLLTANSRSPKALMGDLEALVAGASVATAAVHEVADRFGDRELLDAIASEQATTERRVRRRLAELPDGTFVGRFEIDSDGVSDRVFPVEALVTITGDSVVVDLSASADQSPGAINASISQTTSAVVFAIRCLIEPDVGMNEGVFVPIEIVTRPGSIVDPTPLAACGGRIVTLCAVIEAVLEALAGAEPKLAGAASGIVHVLTLSGQTDDGPWLVMLYDFGGLGARRALDGAHATGAYLLGGRSVIPQVEPVEARYPFLVRSLRLRPDSGGAGQWRGGAGVEVEFEMQDHAQLIVRGDRIIQPPPGADGGHPGVPGGARLVRTDGTTESLPAKCRGIELRPGDRLFFATSGGGGFGPPCERAPDAVRADVAAGILTHAAAARDHGVAVS